MVCKPQVVVLILCDSFVFVFFFVASQSMCKTNKNHTWSFMLPVKCFSPSAIAIRSDAACVWLSVRADVMVGGGVTFFA